PRTRRAETGERGTAEVFSPRRSEAARRSRRLSRGPQSIATVGTGVARPVFPVISPIRLISASPSMLGRTHKAGDSRPIHIVLCGIPGIAPAGSGDPAQISTTYL